MRDEIINVGGRFEDLAEIAAATDRDAVLRAAEALKRDEAGPDHMMDLFTAIIRLRGPYILRLEAEISAYYALAGSQRSAEGQAEHLAQHRDEMRRLFRRDPDAIIREAEGK
jgi:hypothetical protein